MTNWWRKFHGTWHGKPPRTGCAWDEHGCIPGKSLTNRYLLLAALADSPSRLRAPLHSRDSALMISTLEALGAQFERIETGSEFSPDLLITPLNLASAPQW